jgi:hypothetical protein
MVTLYIFTVVPELSTPLRIESPSESPVSGTLRIDNVHFSLHQNSSLPYFLHIPNIFIVCDPRHIPSLQVHKTQHLNEGISQNHPLNSLWPAPDYGEYNLISVQRFSRWHKIRASMINEKIWCIFSTTCGTRLNLYRDCKKDRR